MDAEKLMRDMLKPLLLEDNFKVIQATRAHDVEVDFTAIKEETEMTSRTTIGIEYKHYRSSVSSSDVYKLIGAASVNSFNLAILATNSRFTMESKKVAMRVEPIVIELMDIDRLKEWVSSIEIDNDINKLQIKHWRSGIRVGQSAVRDFLNVIIQEWHREYGLLLRIYQKFYLRTLYKTAYNNVLPFGLA
jgi:hypothetical protein